jgi:hypothetical protein
MSHSTVYEKFSLLYDLFDWIDGSNEHIKANVAFELISTVLNRSLYFLPRNELFNTIEHIFSGSVSLVQRAIWTKDISGSKIITIDQLPQSNMISFSITRQVEWDSIDVT